VSLDGSLAADGRRGVPALAVDRLTKRFGDRVAFQDVSFEVGYGEVFGFLGPNGAGKTTTVRTLGTLIAPSSGSATVAGVPLRPENGVEIRRRIAMMPESPGLYLRLSVTENLECFADLYHVPDAHVRCVIEQPQRGQHCGSAWLPGSLTVLGSLPTWSASAAGVAAHLERERRWGRWVPTTPHRRNRKESALSIGGCGKRTPVPRTCITRYGQIPSHTDFWR
jgi:ABC-type Fe3+/spermidine/putrescine transport system ATPase subunit